MKSIYSIYLVSILAMVLSFYVLFENSKGVLSLYKNGVQSEGVIVSFSPGDSIINKWAFDVRVGSSLYSVYSNKYFEVDSKVVVTFDPEGDKLAIIGGKETPVYQLFIRQKYFLWGGVIWFTIFLAATYINMSLLVRLIFRNK